MIDTAESKEEKLENYLLGSMAKFLTYDELDLDNYLIGYDGPEIIYDLSIQDDFHGDFVLDGEEVEPRSLYVMSTKRANSL